MYVEDLVTLLPALKEAEYTNFSLDLQFMTFRDLQGYEVPGTGGAKGVVLGSACFANVNQPSLPLVEVQYMAPLAQGRVPKANRPLSR
jgi:hypothetical protein